MMSVYPCLDELRRYRAFPCSQCTASHCWTGRKPKPTPRLHPGQQACNHCGAPFTPNGRSRYCTDSCRYDAMMKRRRDRDADRRTGGQGRVREGYWSRNQFGRFWVAPR